MNKGINILRTIALLLLSMLVVTSSVAVSASSSSPSVVGPVLVSQETPLIGCGSDEAHQGWDSEPTLATSQGRLITAWTQDWSDAISVAISEKGSRWSQVLPMTTACTGGLSGFVSAYDPMLSVGPASSNESLNRVVYLSSAMIGKTDEGVARFATVVNRSVDGGLTWSAPVKVTELVSSTDSLDGSTVTADPYHAGVAYVTWRGTDGTQSERSMYFAKTNDGGATWTDPVALPAIGLPATGNLQVLSNGSLAVVSVEVPPQPGFATGNLTGPSTIVVSRSKDEGRTWSEPKVVAEADPLVMVAVRSALGPDGSLYATWQRVNGASIAPSFDVMFTRSKDGGQNWSEAQSVGETIPGPPEFSAHGSVAAAPSFALSSRGTIGVGFYDHRNDVPRSSPPKITDYWFRISSDDGATWSETHLAGPFDQTSAPSDPSPTCPGAEVRISCPGVLGDYQGITAVNGGFALTYTLAAPLAASEPTDIFFSRISGK